MSSKTLARKKAAIDMHGYQAGFNEISMGGWVSRNLLEFGRRELLTSRLERVF
jgi:hypothetical protein